MNNHQVGLSNDISDVRITLRDSYLLVAVNARTIKALEQYEPEAMASFAAMWRDETIDDIDRLLLCQSILHGLGA